MNKKQIKRYLLLTLCIILGVFIGLYRQLRPRVSRVKTKLIQQFRLRLPSVKTRFTRQLLPRLPVFITGAVFGTTICLIFCSHFMRKDMEAELVAQASGLKVQQEQQTKALSTQQPIIPSTTPQPTTLVAEQTEAPTIQQTDTPVKQKEDLNSSIARDLSSGTKKALSSKEPKVLLASSPTIKRRKALIDTFVQPFTSLRNNRLLDAVKIYQETETPQILEEPTATESPTTTQGSPKNKEVKKKQKPITVTASRTIDMYEDSDDTSPVVKKIPAGCEFTVTGTEYGYLYATYKRISGFVSYVYTNYLDKIGRYYPIYRTIFPSEKLVTTGYLTADSVNLRSLPGISSKSKIIDTIDSNVGDFEVLELVYMLEDEDIGWYYIKVNGKLAYVSAEYVGLNDLIYVPANQPCDKPENEKMQSEKGPSKEEYDKMLEKQKEAEKKKDSSTKEDDDKKDSSKKETDKKHSSKEDDDNKKAENKKESSKEDNDNTTGSGSSTGNSSNDSGSNGKQENTIGSGGSTGKKENTIGSGGSTGKPSCTANSFLKATDKNVYTLGSAMTAETGDLIEQGWVGQVLINKATINKMSLEKVLSAPNQYPVTWRKIKSGRIHPSKRTLRLARQLLEGKMNGFEKGTKFEKGLKTVKNLWSKIYYQASDNPAKWSYPKTVIRLGREHYYAVNYLVKKDGKPVYYINLAA